MPVAQVVDRLRSASHATRRYLSMLHPEFRAAGSASAPAGTPADQQLAAAMMWLCRAQDATPDDGVARGFALVYQPFFGGRGWQGSYPETTGYIIPTFFDYAARTGNSEYADRATRMAAWESACQLPSGAVQGGIIGQNPSPAVFNTGQVIFGWVRAFKETGDASFLDSAVRAGRYLVEGMAEDGGWYRELSDYVDGAMTYRMYNVRCAWALAELAEASGDRSFSEAAKRAGHFAVQRQQENGWFPSNCLFNSDLPHLHTIAYSTRGLIETGTWLGVEEFVQAGRRAADAVLAKMRSDGSISDRFDRNWHGPDEWSCLTGIAQIALCWGRLFERHGGDQYLEGVRRASGYLRRHQLYSPRHPNLHGGITGSYPLGGRYGPYQVLNWATKFFADLLMLEERITPAGTRP